MEVDRKKLWLFVLLIGLQYHVFSQEKDAGMWLSVTGTIKLTPTWSFTISEELRLKDNFRAPGTIHTDASLEYSKGAHWRWSGSYRFISKQQPDQGYSFFHRYYGDVRYRAKFNTLILSGRIRIQQQDDAWMGMSDQNNPEHDLRARLELQWRKSGFLRPYIGGEIFHPVIAWQIQVPDKFRIKGGAVYEINKVHAFDFYYMVEREVNVRNPETGFIVGLEYKYSPRNIRLRKR